MSNKPEKIKTSPLEKRLIRSHLEVVQSWMNNLSPQGRAILALNLAPALKEELDRYLETSSKEDA